MIDRYGAPDLVTSDRLEWIDREQFTRIVVHSFDARGVVSQTIRYNAPGSRVGTVALGDCLVQPERQTSQLTAFCDRPSDGYLALNLANDVITGRKDIDQARSDFDHTSRLGVSGKSSDSTRRLLFPVKNPSHLVYSDENADYIQLD